VLYLGPQVKETVYTEAIWENGAEEDIWDQQDEVTGDWRKLHNQKHHVCTPHQLRRLGKYEL
jgi:hypothetical protein